MKRYEFEEFRDLNISDEDLEDYYFDSCDFINCHFENFTIRNSFFTECKFTDSQIINLSAKGNTQVQNLIFEKSLLMGINWKEFLVGDGFLEPINKIEKSTVNYNTFYEMDFKKFDFKGNEILNTEFTKCNLTESDFNSIKLNGSNFFECDLKKSDFRNASGYEVNILTCSMKNAKFSLPEVINLLNILDIKIE